MLLACACGSVRTIGAFCGLDQASEPPINRQPPPTPAPPPHPIHTTTTTSTPPAVTPCGAVSQTGGVTTNAAATTISAAAAAANIAAAGSGSSSALSRSLPRAISSTARRSPAAPGAVGGGASGNYGVHDGDDEEEDATLDFVPPHVYAASLAAADPTALAGEALLGGRSFSLSAKGAAALRMRSYALQRTGFMDGRMGG